MSWIVRDQRVEPTPGKAVVIVLNDHGDSYTVTGGNARKLGGTMSIGSYNGYAYTVDKDAEVRVNGEDAGIQSSSGSYVDGVAQTIANPFTATGDLYIYAAWH